MNESIYAGAYWHARSESLAECANRMWLFLTRIKEINPLFEHWYPKIKNNQELTNCPIKNIEKIQALLGEKRNRRDDNGKVIEQLGFSFSAWNGEHDELKSLDITAQMGGASAWVKNNLVMRLPRGEHCLSEKQTRMLFEAMINASDPAYATISSNQCRDRIQLKKDFTFGWMGYVNAKIEVQNSQNVEAKPFENGTLLNAKLVQFSSTDERHLDAVKELNCIIRVK